MTLFAITLLVGMVLSALFSGSETGFYRVTRVRLALDALSGNWTARGLLWLTNNPAFFVATILIGNNLANFVVSRSIVQMTQASFGPGRPAAEILVPIVMTPLVFVYGELLPKHIFYLAPNRLLRRVGWFSLVATVVIAPVSILLWLLGRGLQALVGESPVITHLRLARAELQKVFDEGHALGILQPVQRQLAQAVFDVASVPVVRSCSSVSRMTTVTTRVPKSEVLRLARRHRVPFVLVTRENSREVQGYVRVVDLYLKNIDWYRLIRPVLKVSQDESRLSVLMRLQTHHELLAEVLDAQDRTVGVVTAQRLAELLLGPK